MTALDCIPNGDIIISGCHGLVSLWRCVDSNLEKVADYAVDGFVNNLKLVVQHMKLYIFVALGKTPEEVAGTGSDRIQWYALAGSKMSCSDGVIQGVVAL